MATIPTNIFCLENVVRLLFMPAALFLNALETTFIMEANTMNPDQTAPLIWVHNVFNKGYQSTTQISKKRTIVLNGGKRG